MGAPKLHHSTEDYSSILETVELCDQVTALQEQIELLRRHDAKHIAYIQLLEPKALVFDKLNTADFRHLNYDYARTVISLSEAIEKNVLELMNTAGVGNKLDKSLSQILTFAEGIQKTVKTDDFTDLQDFLSKINDQKLIH